MTQAEARDRKTYLGSGDIAAVAGLSPYSSALDVWAKKSGVVGETPDRMAMMIGRALERPVIEALYAAPRRLVVTYPGWVAGPREHEGATPDAFVVAEPGAPITADRGVECKIVGHRMAHRWGTEEQGIDAVPADVLAQVQWQLMCTTWPVADVVALLGTELRVFEVARDDEMIGSLVEIGARFWRDHVIANVAPEVTEEGAKHARDLLARIYPRQKSDALLDMPADVRLIVEHYLEARAAAKEADQTVDQAAALLQSRIGDGAGFKAPDLKASWIAGAGGTTRWKEVAARYRDVAMRLGASGADLDALEEKATTPASRRLDVREVKR